MTEYVTGYGRISVDQEESGEGIENMKYWFKAWAASAFPGVPTRWYYDNDISGTRADREGFIKLQAAIRAGEVAELWVRDIQRLQRDKDIWFGAEGLQRLFISNRLFYVYSYKRGAQAGAPVGAGRTPVDDLVTDIETIVGDHRRKEDRKNLMNRQERDAYKGYPPQAPVFGYKPARKDGKRTLEIVPEQAEVIRAAAAQIRSGRSSYEVTRAVLSERIRGARGAAVYASSSIESWVTNATVAGLRRYRGEILRDENGAWIRGNWPPILDVKTWEEVCAVIESRKGRRGGQGRRKYLLSGGLIRCERCDQSMVGWHRPDRKSKYEYKCTICGTTIKMPDVDEIVLDHVGDQLAELVDLAKEMNVDDHADRRDEIHRAIEGINTKRVQAKEDWATDLETREGYQDTLRRLKQRENLLRSELAKLIVPSSQDDPDAALSAFLAARADAVGGDTTPSAPEGAEGLHGRAREEAIETVRSVASEWVKVTVSPSGRRGQPAKERISIVDIRSDSRYDAAL